MNAFGCFKFSEFEFQKCRQPSLREYCIFNVKLAPVGENLGGSQGGIPRKSTQIAYKIWRLATETQNISVILCCHSSQRLPDRCSIIPWLLLPLWNGCTGILRSITQKICHLKTNGHLWALFCRCDATIFCWLGIRAFFIYKYKCIYTRNNIYFLYIYIKSRRIRCVDTKNKSIYNIFCILLVLLW